MVAEHGVSRPLHREDDVARVADGRGEDAIFLRIGGRIIERDVEGDHARAKRPEGPEKIGVRLARQRVATVLGDGGIVDRHDRHLVEDGLRGREAERLIVDGGLERRVEELP